jgi:hypothetical protein
MMRVKMTDKITYNQVVVMGCWCNFFGDGEGGARLWVVVWVLVVILVLLVVDI